ncbi:MAG: AI-2E family transporter, partial [Candidatus Hydrogenedentales bacterium]
MARLCVTPAFQSTLTVLTSVIIGVVVITGLYWAQAVLIPIALAVFLAFPLAPLVSRLQRWHLGRKPSVVAVVLFAALVLGGVVWVVEIELSGLAHELPTYTDNIRAKVKDLRQLGHSAGVERLGKLSEVITGEWEKSLTDGEDKDANEGPESLRPLPAITTALPEDKAQTPSAPFEGPTWLSGLPALLGSALESIGSFILALVLVVFILLERETLR